MSYKILQNNFGSSEIFCTFVKQNLNNMTQDTYTSPVGISVSKGSWEGAQWTITGYPRKQFTIKEFDSAYDFEEYVKKNINCSNIDFDSESCQFFAYAKTKQRAVGFAKAIDKYFEKVRKIVG